MTRRPADTTPPDAFEPRRKASNLCEFTPVGMLIPPRQEGGATLWVFLALAFSWTLLMGSLEAGTPWPDRVYYGLLVAASMLLLAITDRLLIALERLDAWQREVITRPDGRERVDAFRSMRHPFSIVFLAAWVAMGTTVITLLTAPRTPMGIASYGLFFALVTMIAGNSAWALMCATKAILAYRRADFNSRILLHPGMLMGFGTLGNRVTATFIAYSALCLAPLPFTEFGRQLDYWYPAFLVLVVGLLASWFYVVITAPTGAVKRFQRRMIELAAITEERARRRDGETRSEYENFLLNSEVGKAVDETRERLKVIPTVATDFRGVMRFLGAITVPVGMLALRILQDYESIAGTARRLLGLDG